MRRFELPLISLFFACWIVTILGQSGLVALAGRLPLSLYGLYSTAAALGWFFGNVYVHRSRREAPELGRRLRLVYLLGPPSIVYLLRTMAPAAEQLLAPLVPVYAMGVYVVFFLVPVVLRRDVTGRQ